LPSFNGVTTCKPFAAGCLAERNQSHLFQPIADLQRRIDDGLELHVRRGIEIEDQAACALRIVGHAVPGMHFQRAHLRHGRQRLDAIDLHVGFLVAAHLDQIEQR
jgi:hypothetical protein